PRLRPGLADDARGAGRPCAGAGGGETRRRCGDAHPLACRTPGWGGGGVRGAGAEPGARTARRARRARRTWPGDGLFRRHAPRGDRLRAGRVGAHRGAGPALRQGLAEPATVLTAVGPPLGGDMEIARWQALRELFDAVCDAPPEHWEPRLRTLSEDPALIAEALDLLHAQTSSFDRALQPLHALMASLPDAELQVGGRLGAWQLVERLGSGGMGTVFVAERADGLFRQRVAIKLLRGTAAGGATAERLAAERQILADLQHPDIARLYDGGTTPAGAPYLVMEYVEGQPLDEYCEQAAPPLRQRLEMFLRICRAVQAAHQRLVVHCDLKPGN